MALCWSSIVLSVRFFSAERKEMNHTAKASSSIKNSCLSYNNAPCQAPRLAARAITIFALMHNLSHGNPPSFAEYEAAVVGGCLLACLRPLALMLQS
jgi:hypothetical protein